MLDIVPSGCEPSTQQLLQSELWKRVDSELRLFLDPLRQAFNESCTVIVVRPWRATRYLSLLPFHLHLAWPDEITELPLTATLSFVPFFDTHLSLAHTALYRVGDANLARRQARISRRSEGRERQYDMRHPDWEAALDRHRTPLENLVLSGASYIAVDRVAPSGNIQRGRRPCLGRYTSRTAPRPRLVTPTARGVSSDSVIHLADSDLLIVDLQRLRARHSLESVRRTLRARGTGRPTLLVASSPSDLIALDMDDILERAQLVALETSPSLQEVKVTMIGRDRLQAERSFEFAVEELRGTSTSIGGVLDLAKSAWWALRQSVGDDPGTEPEYRQFLAGIDRLRSKALDEANCLVAGEQLLAQAAADAELGAERRARVVDAVLGARGGAGILVIARNAAAAGRLRQESAEQLKLPVDALAELGVRVQTHHAEPPRFSPTVAILAGYFGLASLDAVLASSVQNAHLVFDPVEVRAAWYGARRMEEILTRLGDERGVAALRTLIQGLAPHIAPHADTLGLSLSLGAIGTSNESRPGNPRHLLPPDQVAVYLTDGTRLDLGLGSRLEVLSPLGGRLRSVPVAQVQPGDQLVLVEEDERALFSQRLMSALDAGPLRDAAQKRITWLAIVGSIYRQSRPNLQEVRRHMAAAGEEVDYATVRSWVRFSDLSDAAVPSRYSYFSAFADALGVVLPPTQLRDIFEGIRRWRVLHRLAGRDLARAIRAAYSGRLDAVTLAKIERDWGFDARTLIQGARVATVDEVVLPGGDDNGSN